MKLYSSGEVADLLGIHRDKVNWALKAGAPEASTRIGNRNGFTPDDVLALHDWFAARGTIVTEPNFTSETITA